MTDRTRRGPWDGTIDSVSTQPLPLTTLPLTGERTVPGVARENYWFFQG